MSPAGISFLQHFSSSVGAVGGVGSPATPLADCACRPGLIELARSVGVTRSVRVARSVGVARLRSCPCGVVGVASLALFEVAVTRGRGQAESHDQSEGCQYVRQYSLHSSSSSCKCYVCVL